MAITNKEEGVWILPQVYNKINEGDIWDYDGITTMYNWGYSNNGQLGRSNKVSLSSPTLLPGTGWMRSYGTTPSTNKITGDSAQFAIKSDGTSTLVAIEEAPEIVAASGGGAWKYSAASELSCGT